MHLGSNFGLQFLVSDSTSPFSKASKSKALVTEGKDKMDPAAIAPKFLIKFLRPDSAINFVDELVAIVDVEVVKARLSHTATESIVALIRRLL